MKKLDLYFFPQCPYCQIVLSAMRMTGLENQVTLHDINDVHSDRQFLVKETGRATVPCLFIDGEPMHESKDIANWLHTYAKELQQQSSGELSGNS